MWSDRLLSLLQLTRMALVFTAIADGLCSIFLWAQFHSSAALSVASLIEIPSLAAAGLTSVGLYGFGMSLNDIIDRRRDVQIAPNRPLPSGRIGVVTAHVICSMLGLIALTGGTIYSLLHPGDEIGWFSLLLVIWTMALIVFYDLAGKYLVWPGILTLGLIRFFHAAAFAPLLPMLWHPLLLLNHIAILSAVCYVLEGKRPVLARHDAWALFTGLGVINVSAILIIYFRRRDWADGVSAALWIEWGILYPIVAAIGFVVFAWMIVRRQNDSARGAKLMLAGLLWLIVYDAAFAAGYVSFLHGLALLALLPMAYCSVVLMRFWSRLISLGKTPQFKRAGNEPPGVTGRR